MPADDPVAEYHPLIVDDPIISMYGESMLVEWATLWSHTAAFQDFRIQVVNHEGDYEEVECQRYEYKNDVEGLFGCVLDPSLLNSDHSILG